MPALTSSLQGIIDRRMLINFRLQPETTRPWLPPYFRPKLVHGWAIAGICLIRLKNMRPHGFPAWLGLRSENAAHRIAVEWEDHGQLREGVYIPRRDTSSRWQALASGRLFPGASHRADFELNETEDIFQLHLQSHDRIVTVAVQARRAAEIPKTSIFTSLAEASDFFARGSAGYSATPNPDCCDGLELHTTQWHVEALAVQTVYSNFFADTHRFPPDTIQFDCALLMRNIEHEWRVLPSRRTA